MIGEYRDGEYNYATASALIEEIVDQFHLRAFVYLECDEYDNVMTTTMMKNDDEANDRYNSDVQFDALLNLVIDILSDREEDDRNAAIADIYDKIHEAIHVDDDDDNEEEYE